MWQNTDDRTDAEYEMEANGLRRLAALTPRATWSRISAMAISR
jgi:hypothetical protein